MTHLAEGLCRNAQLTLKVENNDDDDNFNNNNNKCKKDAK
jgi:hypothetical protein